MWVSGVRSHHSRLSAPWNPVDKRWTARLAHNPLRTGCVQAVDNSQSAGAAQSCPQLVPRLTGTFHKPFVVCFLFKIKYLMMFSADFCDSIITMLLIYSLLLFWYWGAASNAFQPATRSVPEAIGASRQCR